jgi:hypothetical protein
MFFRRETPRILSFDEKIGALRSLGFETAKNTNGAIVSRKGFAAVVKEGSGGAPQPGEVGLLMGDHIAGLVDGGYQKFFLTHDNHKVPALAEHLKAIHAFQEDLYEGLGLPSLYNLSLGSVCKNHLYDRVKDRDKGVPTRAWE